MGKKIGIRKGEDALLLLSLLTVTFLLFNISLLLQRISEEDRYAAPLAETASIITMFPKTITQAEMEEKQKELIFFLAQMQEGNASIRFPVYVNDQITQETAFVLLKDNEKITEALGDDSGVYIGESLLEATELENEKRYIELSGIRFPVAGILENHSSGGADHTVFILWERCGEEQKQELLRAIPSNHSILLQSRKDLTGICLQVTEKLTELGMQGLTVEAAYVELENRWYRTYYSLFQGVTAVFCLITCWAASGYWIAGKQREIVIRRTFGYDLRQLAFFLGGELLKLEGAAFVGAFLLEILYLLLTGEIFRSAAWGKVILWTFFMQNILTGVGLGLMMKKVKNLSMAELLKEE